MSVIAKFRQGKGGPGGASGVESPRPAAPVGDDAPTLSAMDRAVKPRRFTPGRIVGALLILFVLAVGVLGYMRYGLTKTLSVSAERVTISSVEKGVFSDYVPVTGNVAPQDTVFLDTVEGGQVTDVMIEDGAAVEAGAPLARL